MIEQRQNGHYRAISANGDGPTYPPPQPPGMSSALERNIQALELRRQREEVEATIELVPGNETGGVMRVPLL